MKSFMFLFWAPKHVLAAPRSPEQARESGDKWRDWEQALGELGSSVTGAQLESLGRCITGHKKTVTEETFGGDHVMGGYFIITASTLEQATELAKGCPVLANGGTVEVRPLVTT